MASIPAACRHLCVKRSPIWECSARRIVLQTRAGMEKGTDRTSTATATSASSQQPLSSGRSVDEESITADVLQPQTNGASKGLSRREEGLEEYKQLKADILQLTAQLTALGTAYCFLGYSLQTALSFSFGCIFSVTYLQLVYKSADEASRSTVPEEFQVRLKRQKSNTSLITSLALIGSPQRLGAGIKLALTSPRLLLPGGLMLLWAASLAAAGTQDAPHLELAPLLMGFFTYKAALLVLTVKEQADLL